MTPLQLAFNTVALATSAKIIRLLLDNGADKSKAPLTQLLEDNPSAARELFNDDVYTNGRDLASKDLVVVIDLNMIHQASQKVRDRKCHNCPYSLSITSLRRLS